MIASAFSHASRWVEDKLRLDGPRAYADTHDVALRLLGASRGPALDLGAGRGELATRLVRRGLDVTAVEAYAAQYRGDAPLVVADLAEQWPFDDASFGIACAVEIIEHLENPRAMLRELARVVRPGGVAIVSTPNLTSLLSRALFATVGQWDLFFDHPWRLRDPFTTEVHGHITPLPRWLLSHHARDAGFEVEAWAYTRAYLPLVPWQLNPLPSTPAFGRVALVRLRRM